MRYRFGLFELDDSELVLHREQAIMRLQSQPARVLACLINNRERVVSREEPPTLFMGRQHLRRLQRWPEFLYSASTLGIGG